MSEKLQFELSELNLQDVLVEAGFNTSKGGKCFVRALQICYAKIDSLNAVRLELDKIFESYNNDLNYTYNGLSFDDFQPLAYAVIDRLTLVQNNTQMLAANIKNYYQEYLLKYLDLHSSLDGLSTDDLKKESAIADEMLKIVNIYLNKTKDFLAKSERLLNASKGASLDELADVERDLAVLPYNNAEEAINSLKLLQQYKFNVDCRINNIQFGRG